MSKHSLGIALVALSLLTASASAQNKFTSLKVYPPDVHLSTKQDLQRFVVVATREDGVPLDVPAQSSIKLADDKLCRMDKFALYPVADGNTMLNVEYQGLTTSAT